jgi:hypothetical protein
MIRQKPYRIGDLVKVKHVHGGYPLPAGLPEGATVRVLAFDIGYRDVEYQGQVFHVAMAWHQLRLPPLSHFFLTFIPTPTLTRTPTLILGAMNVGAYH